MPSARGALPLRFGRKMIAPGRKIAGPSVFGFIGRPKPLFLAEIIAVKSGAFPGDVVHWLAVSFRFGNVSAALFCKGRIRIVDEYLLAFFTNDERAILDIPGRAVQKITVL